MSRFPLFSQRNQNKKDVALEYAKVPRDFRVQVVHIIKATIPANPYAVHEEHWNGVKAIWPSLFGLITKELAVFHLGDANDHPCQQILEYLLKCDHMQCLDIIELLFIAVDRYVRECPINNSEMIPDSAIEELNQRFHQYNLGYKFNRELIKVDSEYLQTEVTEPALKLLRDEQFEGAEAEFLRAHKHFRTNHYEECIVFANRALESTLKTICEKKKWKYDKNAPASKLISTVIEQKLIPMFLQTQLNQLQALLESGNPTIRNKLGGHGQGEKVRKVPGYMASYALNLAATTITMLVHSYNEKKK